MAADLWLTPGVSATLARSRSKYAARAFHVVKEFSGLGRTDGHDVVEGVIAEGRSRESGETLDGGTRRGKQQQRQSNLVRQSVRFESCGWGHYPTRGAQRIEPSG